MCSSFQAENLSKRCLTKDTYFAIRGSHDSYSSFTCPTTNCESLRIKSMSAYTITASSIPTSMASYSDSLLEVLKPKRIACSILPDRRFKLQTDAGSGLPRCPVYIKDPPVQAALARPELGDFCYKICQNLSFFSQPWFVLNTEFGQFNRPPSHPPEQVRLVNSAPKRKVG